MIRSIILPKQKSHMKLFHYIKFCLFHIIGLTSVIALLAGGEWTTIGVLAIVAFYLVGDALGGDDTSVPQYKTPKILTFQLWLALPLIIIIVFTFLWTVSTPDVLGYGKLISELTTYDVLQARDSTTFGHHISGLILTGLMVGLIGTITAHELTHRTWDPVSLFIGRWLLAFSYDTVFATEHVFGHHRYVSTDKDPATAPRGRNVYAHILVSTIEGNISAWHIESKRLFKKGYGLFSWHNAVIRGYLMSIILTAIAFAMGGVETMLYFIVVALWAKSLLEIVNYMEHYGIVRDPRSAVNPRHSWNTNRRVSSWTMFNLTRHSHHHARGATPFHKLKPIEDAPKMISGYLTTIIITMIPPLWHRLMTPKLIEWDEKFATPEERKMAEVANKKSGVKV